MPSRDGNGWVRCDEGHRHWGRFGAAGLLAYVPDGPVLLQRRTWWSHHGGTWGLPGGARDSHETALAAALREAAEECDVPPSAVRPSGVFTDDHGGWSYTSVLAAAAEPFAVRSDDDETDEVAWVAMPQVAGLGLHPGFAVHWPELRAELSPLTIIVDGANVVGSRPDGWWRDRAAAAVRLRDELAPLAATGISKLPDGVSGLEAANGQRMRWMPSVVLVVEGAARPAATSSAATSSAAAGSAQRDAVQVLAADGEGDDTIAALAGSVPGRRVVVTADRGLRDRCRAAGASVAGPSWLLGLL
jgi:8-oxo-dGTP diphosphatase